MSSSLRIHRIFPQNKKSTYSELENIDFDLTFPNRKLICNSVRIEGKVKIYQTGNTRTKHDSSIFIDNMVGANAFFESIETSAQNRGILENSQNMPRYAKMVSTGSATATDMSNLSNAVELKTQNLRASRSVFNGVANAQQDDQQPDPNNLDAVDFSIKPLFILNQVQRGEAAGDVNLDNSTMGDIRVTVRLNSNIAALQGIGQVAGSNFELEDLSLVFQSLPSDGRQSKLVMRTKQLIRQTINSGLANITVNVPQMTNGVSTSFIASTKANSLNHSNTQLDRPPNVKLVEFTVNDSPSDFITFQLTNQQQILQYYLDSISNSMVNRFTPSYQAADEAFGIGAKFGDLLDLSKDKFGMNITSDTTIAYTVFMYFHGMVFV
jgi:hypothetical protein